MAPITPLVATLLAAASLVDAAATPPVIKGGGHHMAPPVYEEYRSALGSGGAVGSVKRGLSSLWTRYYGDERGMARPESLPEKRANKLPPGWENYGCVTESYQQRLLQGKAFTAGTQSPLLCMTTCQQLGFSWAGTEYVDECYCGNEFHGGGGEIQDASKCNMPCKGDATEMCGGPWYLNVYKLTAANTTDSCSSATTSASLPPLTATPTLVPTTSLNSTTALPTASPNTTVSLNSTTTATTIVSSTGTALPSPTATLIPVTNDTSVSEWASHGCAIDSGDNRILSGWSNIFMKQLTTDQCLSTCEDAGFKYAGTEYGEQCYCGNDIPAQIHFDDAQCTIQCVGSTDPSEKCGGFWAMNLYELVSSAECPVDNSTSTGTASATTTTGTVGTTRIGDNNAGMPTQLPPVITTALPTTAVTTVPKTTVAPTTAPTVSPVPTTSPGNPPSTSGPNQVWAHHMVGNTYPYQVSDWLIDIRGAAAVGIDGFALNMGVESWQVDRVADAYTAAQQSGLNFKLFLSLDMTSLGCWSSSDASNLVGLVSRWANHPNAAMHNGKVLVSTFAGSDCHFGQGRGSSAWQQMFVDALKGKGVNIFFVPSIFSDISTFSSNTWMDGELNWNSAWPMNNGQISTATDNLYMSALGAKEYMGAVSPFFYTHFAPNSWNKNWLYRSDDWMYCQRWEDLISMRDRVKQVEILTWNDYGESSHIGPIHGALPQNSGDWVNGLDHQGLNVLTQYYATAYKTGQYPAITQDKLIAWTRPHSYNANASRDPVGKPTGYDWTTDYVWAVVMATAPSTVTLTSGSNTQTFQVAAGLSKLKLPNAVGSVTGTVTRNGNTVASVDFGSFQWTTTPQLYNYNYIVAASQ